MDYMIFGAQGTALCICKALQKLNSRCNVLGFVVTNKEYNPDYLNGLAVFELKDLRDKLSDKDWGYVEFLIATPENVQPEIEEILESHGFFQYRRVTSDDYADFMEMYYAREGAFSLLRSLPMGHRKSFVRCLVALSEVDKPLRSSPSYEDWLEPVQAGSALGTRIIANLRDDTGENISYKNRNYSELTALYWLWKNRLQGEDSGHIYYGLMQYRRRLQVSEDDLYRLEANEVDVVLP